MLYTTHYTLYTFFLKEKRRTLVAAGFRPATPTARSDGSCTGPKSPAACLWLVRAHAATLGECGLYQDTGAALNPGSIANLVELPGNRTASQQGRRRKCHRPPGVLRAVHARSPLLCVLPLDLPFAWRVGLSVHRQGRPKPCSRRVSQSTKP